MGKVEDARLGRQPFMEMVSKQFSPFMEMVVQLCLTTHATQSYSLCNYVLRSVSISGCLKWLHTVLGNLLELPKAVAYHFHKRCRQTVDTL
jgi:hypothetical protein